jgi:glucosylceramidase
MDAFTTDRRTLLLGGAALAAAPRAAVAAPARDEVEWIATTRAAPWRPMRGARLRPAAPGEEAAVTLAADQPRQAMAGFGACFNELGWDALRRLPEGACEAALAELFGPDGARFTLCRLPIGANDFARDWYSFDETPGDFALDHFSIARDETGLIPFIKAAQRHRPDLRLWASPWSPPSWMKRNGHYAMALSKPGQPPNGLRPDQVGREGADMFIQEPRYFDAYARYFGRFVDAYRAHGIPVGMVMPQNEFNSAQVFPSCCWTPEGLARFIPHLGEEMGKRGVDLFFGTFERPDDGMFERVYADPKAGPFIRGVGIQWAGKGALPFIHHAHPDLPIYQSEQECGDGRNDWRYARYAWTLMKHYLRNGTSGYLYWNIALDAGGVSRWGWKQNSLLTVDPRRRTLAWNHEYWLMKHVAHFVPPGSRRIEAVSWTGYDDVLAFVTPAGESVAVAANPLGEAMPMTLGLGAQVIELTLPPDSFSTLRV